MSIRVENGLILQVPKCGSRYISHVLKENEIPFEKRQPTEGVGDWIEKIVPPTRSWHRIGEEDIKDIESGVPVVAFQRDYISWYKSFWKWMTERKMWFLDMDISETNDGSFDGFVAKMEKRYPNGFVRHLYADYAKYATMHPLSEIHTVLEGLVGKMKKIEPQNTTRHLILGCEDKIIEMEGEYDSI